MRKGGEVLARALDFLCISLEQEPNVQEYHYDGIVQPFLHLII